jgi:hypothetical protein
VLEGQKKRLQEVLDCVKATAEAKGWHPKISSKDKQGWKYASVSVERYFGSVQVTGNFDITVEDGVQVHSQKTSFYGHGLDSLLSFIISDLGQLKWLKPVKKVIQQKSLPPLTLIKSLLRQFHLVARQLQHRYNDRNSLIISDEYDVQDLLHALLRIYFDDIRPEEHTPSYAGGASRVDFLLKKEKIVIEVKITSTRLRDRQIGEQLIIDIQRYQAHQDCETLVCFVYDPGGLLKNPAGLANDLSKKHDRIVVSVIIVPSR